MEKSPAYQAVGDVEVKVAVRVAETALSLADVLALRSGSTISFPQRVSEPLALEVDGATLGHGYLAQRDGRLGFLLETLEGEEPPESEARPGPRPEPNLLS